MKKKEREEFFDNNYELIGGGTWGEGRKTYLGQGGHVKCRFCNKDKNEATSRNIAHAIPEFLGNKQLILRDECDECNKFFSENLEEHLDKYIKPYRTIGKIKGKKKIPTVKSMDKKSRLEFEDGIKITSPFDSDFCKINRENNALTLNVELEPYIPAAVFKAFIKIAISTIEDVGELEAFKYTIRWLKESDHSKKMIEPMKVLRAMIPGFQPNKEVVTALLRRKEGKQVPYSVFIIYFGNFIHQLNVPSHLDANSGETIKIKPIFYPSPFEEKWPMGNLKLELIDLTSHERVYEKRSISFSYERLEEIG